VGDEVSSGRGGGPRRPPTALLVLLAAAVVVAGVVSLRHGVEPVRPPASAPASSPAVQMPAPPGELSSPATEPLPEVPALMVGQVCGPLRTDGRSRLDVTFMLVNTLPRAVTLLRVKPVFPLAGLRQLSTEYRSGTCADRGPPLRAGEVRAGGTLLVVLRLALPPTCPAPYPVEVDLTERRDGRTVTAGLHLLNDLGNVHFTTC
jgi:hypothetical protein